MRSIRTNSIGTETNVRGSNKRNVLFTVHSVYGASLPRLYGLTGIGRVLSGRRRFACGSNFSPPRHHFSTTNSFTPTPCDGFNTSAAPPAGCSLSLHAGVVADTACPNAAGATLENFSPNPSPLTPSRKCKYHLVSHLVNRTPVSGTRIFCAHKCKHVRRSRIKAVEPRLHSAPSQNSTAPFSVPALMISRLHSSDYGVYTSVL